MLLNKFIREDETVIGSDSIISCEYISDVNSQTNLSVGDTTSAEVTVELRTPKKLIVAGEKLTYYQIEDGVETLIGVFYAETPTIATKSSIRIVAYDATAKLAVGFSDWLNDHQNLFPMSLRKLVEYACQVAGVTVAEDSFPHESLSIPAFYADGVTTRQIVSWAAQIAGRFVNCNTAGEIEFSWYQSTDTVISARNEASYLYMQDSLRKKAYSTETIKRVQFKQDTDDIGVIYPKNVDGNVFTISHNGIAALLDSDTLLEIAKTLYEQLKSISYTPLECRIKRTSGVRPGDIISVTDGNGISVITYVMKVCLNSSGTTITSTGDSSYSDKAAVSTEEYKNIPGKILNIRKDIDGLVIENKKLSGEYTNLKLSVDGLETAVGDAEENISELQQTAGQVKVSVTDSAGTLSTTINAKAWEAIRKNLEGETTSGFYYDFALGRFVYDGTGVFRSEDGSAYIEVESDGLTLYANGGSGSAIKKLHIGFTSNGGIDYPYIQLGAGVTDSDAGLIKKFGDGVFIGNGAAIDDSGKFRPKPNYVGIFVNTITGKTYVVNGTSMMNIYTGDAIARFG